MYVALKLIFKNFIFLFLHIFYINNGLFVLYLHAFFSLTKIINSYIIKDLCIKFVVKLNFLIKSLPFSTLFQAIFPSSAIFLSKLKPLIQSSFQE